MLATATFYHVNFQPSGTMCSADWVEYSGDVTSSKEHKCIFE